MPLKYRYGSDVSNSMTYPLRAFILSVIGALIGGALWLLIAIAADLERAIPAILVGVLAGAATRLEPFTRGLAAQVFSVIVALLVIVIVQYFVVRHAVVEDLVAAGRDRSIPMLLSIEGMWRVTFGWLRTYPVDLIPWAVSLAAAFLLPAGAGVGTADTMTHVRDAVLASPE